MCDSEVGIGVGAQPVVDMAEALGLMAQMQRGCEELTDLLAQAQLNGDGALGQMARARNLVRVNSTEGDEEGTVEAPSQIPAALERARRASGKESPILADLRAALRKELLVTEQLRKELEQEREARVAAERQLRELQDAMGTSATGASSPNAASAASAASGTDAPVAPLTITSQQAEEAGDGGIAGSPGLVKQLEQMQVEVQREHGSPRNAAEFVKGAVAGTLAAASVGSFKLLHSIMPKSPESGGKNAASASAAGAAATAAGIDAVSSSSSAASVEE